MRNSWIPRVATLLVLWAFFISDVAFGRMRWPERDGKPILLPRRIQNVNLPEIQELSQACPPGIGLCAQLAGAYISTLLAAAPECAQQDASDTIIDDAKNKSNNFPADTQTKMISLAVILRGKEKNTQLDFSVQPPIKRNSLFCPRCPKNQELLGIVQAQDPANNKSVFADPITGKSILLGTQADTRPPNCTSTSTSTGTTNNDAATKKTDNNPTNVCTANKKGSGSSASSSSLGSTPSKSSTSLLSSNATGADFGKCSTPEIKFAADLDGRKETAFAPTDPVSYNHGSADNIGVITQFMCDALTNTCAANQAAKDLCKQAAAAASSKTPAQSGAQADAFNAVFNEKTDFSSVTVIDNTGKPVGGTSQQSVSAAVANTNASLSAANFGKCSTPEVKFAADLDGRKETAFAPTDPASYDHGSAQGIFNIVEFMCDALTNTCEANQAAKDLCRQAEAAAQAAQPPNTGIQADTFNKFFGIKTNFAAVTPLDDHGDPVGQPNNGTNSAISTTAPNFGKCSTPEIKFATDLDGRKETAFAPNDPVSYNHGSADNIGVITQFMCDALTNTCAANQAAKDLCTKGESAASAAKPPLSGAQADAFNAIFGINTDFAKVTPISNTGVPVNQ